MRKRPAVVLTAIAFLTLTGVVAARQFIDLRPSGGFSDHQGRMWNFQTGFQGKIQAFDANGALVGTFTNEGVGSKSGSVTLTVSNQRFTLHGSGRHALRTPKGQLIGTVELSALTAEEGEVLEREEQQIQLLKDAQYRGEADAVTIPGDSARSGAEGGPGICTGFDRTLGVSWNVRGYADVKVRYLYPDGKHLQGGAGAATLPTPEEAETLPPAMRSYMEKLRPLVPKSGAPPQITWALAGKESERAEEPYPLRQGRWAVVAQKGGFSGYGVHRVTRGGKEVMELVVTPLPSPQK